MLERKFRGLGAITLVAFGALVSWFSAWMLLILPSFDQVRCGVNQVPVTFWVLIGGLGISAIIAGLFVVRPRRQSALLRIALALLWIALLAVLGWTWWLAPECPVPSR